MSETLLLFDQIDKPGLNTLDVYRDLGGYAMLRRALTEMSPDEVLAELQASNVRGDVLQPLFCHHVCTDAGAVPKLAPATIW